MSWAILGVGVAACAGWSLALALALSLRRWLSLVADAEHELRGAAAAIGLAAERVSRSGATVAFHSLVRLQLDRMAAGLEDLAAARTPRRAARAATRGDAELDAGRLAQVVGNLVANATEHGVGAVDVSTSRPPGAVRIEIRNRNRPRELDGASPDRPGGRGRGLAIAERAARELGGRLSVESRDGETLAKLELPAREPGRTAADASPAVGEEAGAGRTGNADGAAGEEAGAGRTGNADGAAGEEAGAGRTGRPDAAAAEPRASRAA